jgi:VWFA-related protein
LLIEGVLHRLLTVRALFTCCLVFTLFSQETTFHTTVPVVIVPATVTTKDGKFLNGLEHGDFTLLDDGRPQRIQLETSDTIAYPLAVVFVVQANNTAPAAIRKIQRIGSMMQPLITGERGHAALLAFGEESKLVQDFTNDAGELTAGFRAIHPQWSKQARMLDAVAEAARMLTGRPQGERRVLIVISESRDRGSKTKLADVVQSVQQAGAAVFTIVFSAYVTPFTTKPADLPQSGGVDLLGAITEPARLAKPNAAQVLAESSGGRKLSFATLRGLENIITGLGEEIHSQYILAYTPSACSPGSHRIIVNVVDRPDAVVRARSVYWTDPGACGGGPKR